MKFGIFKIIVEMRRSVNKRKYTLRIEKLPKVFLQIFFLEKCFLVMFCGIMFYGNTCT